MSTWEKGQDECITYKADGMSHRWGLLRDSTAVLGSCRDKPIEAGHVEALPFVCGLGQLTGTGADLKKDLSVKVHIASREVASLPPFLIYLPLYFRG